MTVNVISYNTNECLCYFLTMVFHSHPKFKTSRLFLSRISNVLVSLVVMQSIDGQSDWRSFRTYFTKVCFICYTNKITLFNWNLRQIDHNIDLALNLIYSLSIWLILMCNPLGSSSCLYLPILFALLRANLIYFTKYFAYLFVF